MRAVGAIGIVPGVEQRPERGRGEAVGVQVGLLEPEAAIGAVQVAHGVAAYPLPQDEVLRACRRLNGSAWTKAIRAKAAASEEGVPNAAAKALALSRGTVVWYVFSKGGSVPGPHHCHACGASGTSACGAGIGGG